MEARILLVTVPTLESAKSLVVSLLSDKLIACANIVPGITSLYWWEGKIDESSELLLILKTTAVKVPEVEKAVIKLHPYTTPEFISIKPEHLGASYLNWLIDSVN